MKLTKKILSLVLAAALVLGSIAVAANAADYDGLAYEGSKLTYVVKADKTEVKPGETVTFSVYMTTNYYTGSAGGLFAIWNAGVFEALGTNYSIKNFGTTFKNTITSPARTAAYPSGYGANDYVAFQAIHQLEAGVTVPAMLDNELVYEFTFKVLETAAPGAKVTFEIPAAAVKSAALPGMKGMTYIGIGTSSSNPTNTKAYAETTDVSAASVTVTVASSVEYCDYSALETAVAKLPALAEEYYDAVEYKAWTDAKAAGQALLDADPLEKSDENQKTIDDAAALVESTLAALDARYLSLDKLNAAVDACDEIDPANKDYYVAEDYEAWEQALAAAKAAQAEYTTEDPATKQAEVDAIADALTEAYGKLSAAYADLTKLNNTVDACDTPEYEEAVYDALLWEAWETALAAAKEAQVTYAGAPAAQQGTIDGIADALQAAYDALVPDVVDLSDLEKAVEESVPEYTEAYYDADEFTAYTTAAEAANNGLVNYAGAANTAENQAAVAKLAADLRDAYAALDARFVDVTPITEAITAAALEYEEEYYNAAALENFKNAVSAGEGVVENYAEAPDTEDNRRVVADAVNEIAATYAALVPAFVSYEKVEQALVDYATPEHPEFYYTTDSWAAYEEAKAAAADANENRPSPLPAATEANQAEVDGYATALENAYKALTPVGGAHVISVTPLQEVYDVNDTINLAVLVDGTATKIQLLKANGSTSTYDRTNAAVKSITDNKDGTETWVISRKVYSKEYTEYAKAKYGKTWDTGLTAYDLKCAGKDSAVKSLTIKLNDEDVTSIVHTDVVTITIVTGPAAIKVRLVDPVTGGAITISTPAAVNEDGTKVWILNKQFYKIQNYDYDVYSKGADNIWVDSGIDLELEVTNEVESQLPSTGNVADAVLSASVAKARLVRGNTQTFNIDTDKAAKAVRIVDENGKVISAEQVSADPGEDRVNWVFTKTYNNIGDYSYTVEALYGSTWIANEEITLDFTVVY